MAKKKPEPIFSSDDLAYAFECAADFLEAEEWPENDGGKQVAAYREAAKRVRKQADYYRRKAMREEMEQAAAGKVAAPKGKSHA